MSLIRDFFTQNLGYKLVSLCFAITFWAWVQSEQRVEQRLKVPVAWMLPDGLGLVEPPIEAAFVTVEGVQGTLRSVRAADMSIPVDLRKATEGEVNVSLTDLPIANLPAGVRIKDIEPDSLKLTLDRIRTRRVRVVADTRGEPAPGYKVGAVKVEPERVDLTGPGSILQTVTEVKTDAVDLSGLRDDAEFEVGVATHKSQLRADKSTRLTVTVSVTAVVKERKFDAVPLSVPPGWLPSVPSVIVTVAGPVDAVDHLDAAGVHATIDVPEGTEPGQVATWGPETGLRLDVGLGTVEGVDVTAVEPARITLERAP